MASAVASAWKCSAVASAWQALGKCLATQGILLVHRQRAVCRVVYFGGRVGLRALVTVCVWVSLCWRRWAAVEAAPLGLGQEPVPDLQRRPSSLEPLKADAAAVRHR